MIFLIAKLVILRIIIAKERGDKVNKKMREIEIQTLLATIPASSNSSPSRTTSTIAEALMWVLTFPWTLS